VLLANSRDQHCLIWRPTTGICLLVQVMTQAGAYVKEEVWRAFIVLLTNSPELHAYAARSLFRALRDNLATAQLSLLATSTWYIGAWACAR
jgi:AP-1 complex subunit gamma-1